MYHTSLDIIHFSAYLHVGESPSFSDDLLPSPVSIHYFSLPLFSLEYSCQFFPLYFFRWIEIMEKSLLSFYLFSSSFFSPSKFLSLVFSSIQIEGKRFYPWTFGFDFRTYKFYMQKVCRKLMTFKLRVRTLRARPLLGVTSYGYPILLLIHSPRHYPCSLRAH